MGIESHLWALGERIVHSNQSDAPVPHVLTLYLMHGLPGPSELPEPTLITLPCWCSLHMTTEIVDSFMSIARDISLVVSMPEQRWLRISSVTSGSPCLLWPALLVLVLSTVALRLLVHSVEDDLGYRRAGRQTDTSTLLLTRGEKRREKDLQR